MKQIQKKLLQKFVWLLYQPYFVFLLCLLFLSLNLVFNGTLFRIFRLNQDLKIVNNRIQHTQNQTEELKLKIKKSQDPEFIKKELRERLDYTEEGDLIFLFPEKNLNSIYISIFSLTQEFHLKQASKFI